MNRRWTAARLHERRRGRQLATEISAAVDRSDARFVLITSARRGDGKTHLADTLRRELAMMGQRRFTVLSWHELAGLRPDEFAPDSVVLVDGPAMLEGEEIFSLPPAWLEVFDASVVVLMKRVTTKSEVLDLSSWLEAAGAAPIGLVWNEHAFPPVTSVLRRVRDWVVDLFERDGRDEVVEAEATPVGSHEEHLATIIARATGSHARIEPPKDNEPAAAAATPPGSSTGANGTPKHAARGERPTIKDDWPGAARWLPPWVAQEKQRQEEGP